MKNKKSTNGGLHVAALALVGSIVLFIVFACGVEVGKRGHPSNELEHVNVYSDGIHYIVFKTKTGGMFAVNQSIDSAKLEQLKPELMPWPYLLHETDTLGYRSKIN